MNIFFRFPIYAAKFHSQIVLISFFHCLLGSLSSFVSNSLFLLLSPLENKIIKLSILMLSLSLSLSLSLLIPFRKRAIFERMRGGAGSKFQHYVNHAPHYSFDLRPYFLLLSYFSTFSSLSFCIC